MIHSKYRAAKKLFFLLALISIYNDLGMIEASSAGSLLNWRCWISLQTKKIFSGKREISSADFFKQYLAGNSTPYLTLKPKAALSEIHPVLKKLPKWIADSESSENTESMPEVYAEVRREDYAIKLLFKEGFGFFMLIGVKTRVKNPGKISDLTDLPQEVQAIVNGASGQFSSYHFLAEDLISKGSNDNFDSGFSEKMPAGFKYSLLLRSDSSPKRDVIDDLSRYQAANKAFLDLLNKCLYP